MANNENFPDDRQTASCKEAVRKTVFPLRKGICDDRPLLWKDRHPGQLHGPKQRIMTSSLQTPENSHAVKCELAGDLLRSSGSLQLRVTGRSMLPAIWPGDTLEIERANPNTILEGDIAMFTTEHRFVAHRVVAKDCAAELQASDSRGRRVPPRFASR